MHWSSRNPPRFFGKLWAEIFTMAVVGPWGHFVGVETASHPAEFHIGCTIDHIFYSWEILGKNKLPARFYAKPHMTQGSRVM